MVSALLIPVIFLIASAAWSKILYAGVNEVSGTYYFHQFIGRCPDGFIYSSSLEGNLVSSHQ